MIAHTSPSLEPDAKICLVFPQLKSSPRTGPLCFVAWKMVASDALEQTSTLSISSEHRQHLVGRNIPSTSEHLDWVIDDEFSRFHSRSEHTLRTTWEGSTPC